MAYNKDNTNYKDLTEDERELIGLEEDEREKAVADILSGMDNSELLQMCRDYNSWNGSFEFCDMWECEEFLCIMTEGKKPSELVDFILDVADAVNDYNGNDVRNAMWGYPNGYDLEIKDTEDIEDEAEDCIEDLAYMIVSDGTYNHIDDMPSDIEDMLSLWEQEDNGEYEDEDEDE